MKNMCARWFNGLKIVLASLWLFTGAHALASDTASSIRGTVVDAAGIAVANATVQVSNSSTSLSRGTTTDTNGVFTIRNLPVDGAYSVSADSPSGASAKLENIALSLGQTTDLTLQLQTSGTIDEVVVVGARVPTQVALGPNATFGLETLRDAPAINRNIADILRRDARIYVDESRGDINAVQCGGKNSRFNSLSVDGVRMNDSFGLNSNGYPTERMPFSYDAINQVAVELAPFDAQYGGFTACNINAVTKSGSNEFSGDFFYDFTNDSLRGDSLEGSDIISGGYDEHRRGIAIGGPIIKDRLFFFASYEDLEGANLFSRGPQGSGAINEVSVTQGELDEIVDIAKTLYQYDPGAIPSSFDNQDEKILVKFDWFINDQQRASFTYNYNDGYNIVASDGDLDEFEFSNHLYERGAELTSYVGSLFSDWSDRFSTQVRFSHLELDNRQLSVGGTDFGEIRVELDDVDVYLGGDDSRQSNKLYYELDNFSLRGTYDLDNHAITAGFEYEALEIFNLFVQHTETEIRFRGIDNFRAGLPRAIYYNNAPSNNSADAAADWGYEVTTLYIQDEFNVSDNLELMAGLRYDRYTSDDRPETNATFLADYGFSNGITVDGKSLVQPRFGFTYTLNDRTKVRGGVGLYSGGNPNVWLSNNYSNNNVLQFGQRGRSFGYTNGSRSLFDADVVYAGVEAGLPAGPGYGIPQELYDAVAGGVGSNFEINYLDPNFELPSDWKAAIGVTHQVDDTLTLQGDLLITRGNDTAIVQRGDLEMTGLNEDGYPIYDSVREPTFVLTNSSRGNESLVASFSLDKDFGNGLSAIVGYAYTDAKDVQPMTSSVAFSNYQNRAFFDPQEKKLSTSNYEIKHRMTLILDWKKMLIGDNVTTVSLYASANQGPSYSFAVRGNGIFNYTPYLEGNNVLVEDGARNDEEGSWWAKADIKVEQEFSVGPSKASAFVIIDNLTNFLNDEWGVMRKVNFPNNVVPGNQAEARIGNASLSEIRFGVRYQF